MLEQFSLDLAESLYHSEEEFPVDLDFAWHWLGYNQKSDCLEKLQNNFEVDSDYFRQTPELPTASNPRPKNKYYLTVECFKSMGMMAGTEKGKEIRKYFLECEKIAKGKTKSKTSAELLLENVRLLVEHEKRIGSIEEKQEKLQNQIWQINRNMDAIDNEYYRVKSELYRFSNPHGECFSVAGYCKLYSVKLTFPQIAALGKECTKYCKEHDVSFYQVYDPRFGKVGVYPSYVIGWLIPKIVYHEEAQRIAE